MADRFIERGAGEALKKICLLAGLIVAGLGLLLVGTIYVKAWAAERRENITFREIAKNNAEELERRDRLLAESREREAGFEARERDRRDALAQIAAQNQAAGVEPCAIDEAVWALLEAE